MSKWIIEMPEGWRPENTEAYKALANAKPYEGEEGLREDIEKVSLETISPPLPDVLKDVLVDRIMACISRHLTPSQGLVGELPDKEDKNDK